MSAEPPNAKSLRAVWQAVIWCSFVAGVCLFSLTVFAADNTAEEAIDRAVEQAVEKAAQETVEKAAEQAVEKAVEKAAEQAVEKAVEKAAEQAAGKAAEKTVERAAEKAAEKAAEMAVEKATEKAAEMAVEKAAEMAMEKAAEEAEVKAEQKAKRPDEWRGPTQVQFTVFVLDIDGIDDAEQNFTTNVFLSLRWQDERLANPEGATRQMPLDAVWNPQVLLANRQGLVSRSLPEVVEVHPDGTVVYRQRYTGKLSQPLRLYEFPTDRHTFTIQFVSAAYSSDHLEFVPGVSRGLTGGSMAKELSLQDWKVVSYEVSPAPYAPIEQIRNAGFIFRFEAERYFAYYIWQVVLPLTVVVVMSWAAFWVAQEEGGVRIGVATSSILTLIAHRFVLASLLPRLPYMTRMDYFTAGSTLLVFLALIAVIFTSYFATQPRHQEKVRKINQGARLVFPTAFLCLLIWFVLG